MKACFSGLGYVGLPTALIAAGHGIEVLGVDINPSVVESINSGKLHIHEPGLDEYLVRALESGMFKAAAEPEMSDAYFIVVPTPFKENHQPDISYVQAATESIIPLLKKGDLYVIESTCPVGTTEKMAALIGRERPDLGDDIFIAYCPERVLPGNVIHELVHNDRIVGGINPQSTEKAKAFYSRFVKGEIHGTDARTAEMCKLTENASRDVQIAFANELSIICEKAGIDVWELIALANKHPRVNILQPGCGVGGHCIAVDPYFITSNYPQESRMIATARELNNYKSFWCVERIQDRIAGFFRENGRKPVVALMGLAFKPDIDDLRESPALYIAKRVAETMENEAELLICEPNIESCRDFSLSDYRTAYEKADLVVFLVAHSQFRNLAGKEEHNIINFCNIK